ncbi:MAG: glycosyltransferase, partial [Oscillospiraceae bacterium]|nr:glycosyltransferase [Oscillospiraceae bacterium]
IAREGIGRAVEIGDGEALRDAIVFLAGHPDERRAMAARAGKLYEERYAYEVAMERYRAMLEKVLES